MYECGYDAGDCVPDEKNRLPVYRAHLHDVLALGWLTVPAGMSNTFDMLRSTYCLFGFDSLLKSVRPSVAHVLILTNLSSEGQAQQKLSHDDRKDEWICTCLNTVYVAIHIKF